MDTEAPATHDEPSTLRSWVAARLPEYLRELAAWVAIPSGTFDHAGVDRMAAVLAARLRALGAIVDLRRDGAAGTSLTARFPVSAPGPRVLVVGHLDTVTDGADTAPALAVRDGRAYGPGAADMKGGLLALVHALEATAARHGSAVPRGELGPVAEFDAIDSRGGPGEQRDGRCAAWLTAGGGSAGPGMAPWDAARGARGGVSRSVP